MVKFDEVKIAEIKINIVNQQDLLDLVEDTVRNQQKLFLVSANSELIYLADQDSQLKNILNNAFCFPESVGLKLVSRQLKQITPGIDLVAALLNKNYRIYLYGSKLSVVQKMQEQYSNVVGFCDGYQQLKNEQQILQEINNLKPDILFVALGAPKQEKWISSKLAQLPVKVAMGVGGSFDVLSGNKKRAPLFFRAIGLEWLYRIIVEWRFKRAWRLIGFLKVALQK